MKMFRNLHHLRIMEKISFLFRMPSQSAPND